MTPSQFGADELEVVRGLARAVVEDLCPEDLAEFDIYWRFFEKNPSGAFAQREGQGGTEVWIHSPWVIGMITGIASNLVVLMAPRAIKAVGKPIASLRDRIVTYVDTHREQLESFLKDAELKWGKHPEFRKIAEALKRLLCPESRHDDPEC